MPQQLFDVVERARSPSGIARPPSNNTFEVILLNSHNLL